MLPNSVIIFFSEVFMTKFSCRLTQTWCLYPLLIASFTISHSFIVHFAAICIWTATRSASRAKWFWNIRILLILLWKSLYREQNCFWNCWIMTPNLSLSVCQLAGEVQDSEAEGTYWFQSRLVADTVNATAMSHFQSDNHGTVLPCFIVKMPIPFPRWNNLLTAAPLFNHLTSVYWTASSYSDPASSIKCRDRPWLKTLRHVTVPITSYSTRWKQFFSTVPLVE